MPSAITMVVAYEAAANFADQKAADNKSYEPIMQRWVEKADIYEEKSKAIQAVVDADREAALKILLKDLPEAA